MPQPDESDGSYDVTGYDISDDDKDLLNNDTYTRSTTADSDTPPRRPLTTTTEEQLGWKWECYLTMCTQAMQKEQTHKVRNQ